MSSEGSEILSNFVGCSLVNNGDIKYYTDYLKLVNSLTPADIQNAAQKYLDLNKTMIVMMKPEKKTC